MACFHPLKAYRSKTGEVKIGKQSPEAIALQLPCGGCLGCRLAAAQAWTLRCQLELLRHNNTVWTTLTYDDKNLPITLQKRHLQMWLKRLRKNTKKKLRFFAVGEYGEHTHRAHYHAILYGLDIYDEQNIQKAWPFGHTRTEPISTARIAYTAGYCHKKVQYRRIKHEKVDPTTGEVYIWQPPFKQMSIKPGIGAYARDNYTQSWEQYAVKDGHKMAVPRYFHEKWKDTASPEQKTKLAYAKALLALDRDTSKKALRAAEKIAEAKRKLQQQRRAM